MFINSKQHLDVSAVNIYFRSSAIKRQPRLVVRLCARTAFIHNSGQGLACQSPYRSREINERSISLCRGNFGVFVITFLVFSESEWRGRRVDFSAESVENK